MRESDQNLIDTTKFTAQCCLHKNSHLPLVHLAFNPLVSGIVLKSEHPRIIQEFQKVYNASKDAYTPVRHRYITVDIAFRQGFSKARLPVE